MLHQEENESKRGEVKEKGRSVAIGHRQKSSRRRSVVRVTLPVPVSVQGSAKEWSLGCVIPASWPPLAVGAHFTQPRDPSFADPCIEFGKLPCGVTSQKKFAT